MEQQALSPTELRVIIAVIGVIAFALIYLFGRPRRPGQGKRTPARPAEGARVEPVFGEVGGDGSEAEAGEPSQGELPVSLDADEAPSPAAPRRSTLGARPQGQIERIVTLYVSARAGQTMAGTDLVVAAEKAGLQFGDMGIFHRLAPGKAEQGPVFSMAQITRPGSFDMARIDQLTTPGVTLFMTLPGPVPALDAWEAMLPAAQRLAELLDGVVLDEQRNALGRQRVAHLRDELRAWDREQERNQIRPHW
ncbi:MAG TPA: cell division protein ZipA [Dokdonella sp.]|uniref:cell division protein ZipA n=1 Tax=Dokdonella sp. TaxID=2291710 RepID=UPI002CFD9085|nr:cell division protein ZipA [Dokdonella sp.]HUD40440.1 cell division protein ZipA [Dokdonella sp.]